MSIRTIVLRQMTEIAAQQRKTLSPLSDNLKLVDSGLDSLCLALLVASLDENLGLDPFVGDVAFPVTVGDFIVLYENVA